MVVTEKTQGNVRPGARELARRAMTAQVAEMALDLFLERGYEETTVEDICAVAGISRSSFFRYFRSKEDVLVHGDDAIVEAVIPALKARPDSETPWVALRRALDPLVEGYLADPERALRWAKLVRETPALATFSHERLVRKGRLLRPEVARRIGSDPDDAGDPRADALIGAALACLDAGATAWTAGDGKSDLALLLDRAMGVIG